MLLGFVVRRLRRYRTWIAAIMVFQIIGVAANLYLPSLNAGIVDDGVSKGDTGFIWSTGGVMLGVSFVQIVATAIATYFAARTAMAFGADLRVELFTTVGTFSSREVNTLTPASLITRNTNDVQQVQQLLLMTLILMVGAPIMAVGGVLMALREAVGLSWLMLVAVPVLAVVLGVVVSRMVPGFRQVQTRLDDVNRVMREQLTGIRVIRAFVRERFEIARFDRANVALADQSIAVMRLVAIMFPFVMLVMNATTVAVWWFGAHSVASGDIEIGALTAYMTYVIQILMAVMMATFMFMMVPRAAVSAERINEVLTTTPSVQPTVTQSAVEAVVGNIAFDNVSMTYPGAEQPVVQGISFTASPGETVAIVGSTGSGKTTLLSLAARLFDATGGSVRIDGIDIRDLAPTALWGHVGIVPQKPYLFSGTVASNLRYGSPTATDEELWEALRIAQADEFVTAMGGLDSSIAQGGTNVSGGQRQRLCIARSLVARPRIHLFDDSFSALDLSTDARLRSALAPHVRDATVLIVAQRISTILHADRIVVLEDGQMAGVGTHAQLLATCATYREIVDSQEVVSS